MNAVFWAFFPDDALVLLVMGAAFLFMLGASRAACGLLGVVLLFVIIGPFIEAAVMAVGPGLQILLLAIVLIVLVRGLIGLVFGRTTASHLAALLLHDLILAPFRIVRWLFGRRR